MGIEFIGCKSLRADYQFQGWFIFTTILLVCTLKSTVAFFSLFFTLDLAFLCLAISFIKQGPKGEVNPQLTIAGGVFGMLAALLAWYNALAGIADTSNRYVNRCYILKPPPFSSYRELC